MKALLAKSILFVLVFWFLAIFMIPGTYPPRETTATEYAFIFLVGVASVLVSKSKAPLRHHFYWGFFALIPALLSVTGTYGSNYDIQIRLGRSPSVAIVFLPLGRTLIIWIASTVIWRYLYWKASVIPREDRA